MITDKITVQLETALFNRAFLPYSIGTPTRQYADAKPYPRANLLFFTDSHVDFVEPEVCMENLRQTMDYIESAPVRPDAVLHGGDIITPFGRNSKEDVYTRADPFFKEALRSPVPFIFAKGNHDLNDWDNLPENVLTDADYGRLFLDEAEKRYGLVRQRKNSGDASTWHYCDLPEHKIRIVSVDTQDVDKTAVDEKGNVRFHGGYAWGVSQEQMDWIVHSALCFDDKEETDWGVIFVQHMDTGYGTFLKIPYENSIQKLLEVCAAFQERRAYTSHFDSPVSHSFSLHIDADFTRYADLPRRPHMICWLIGHNHTDSVVCDDSTHGIPMIYTANASCTNVCSDERLVRIPGTSTQNCFDILNIDTHTRRIRIFRYGAGVNCYGEGGHRFLPDGLAY